jgi:hypothetical protein
MMCERYACVYLRTDLYFVYVGGERQRIFSFLWGHAERLPITDGFALDLLCLLAYLYLYLAVAVALQRQQGASSDLDSGLIPVTVPELLRLSRGTVIPPPRRGRP